MGTLGILRLKRILFLLALTILLAACDSSARVQGEMRAHLKQAYDMEFVVEMPEFQGVNGMWPGIYTSEAWPKDNPAQRFSVFWSTGEPPEAITDTYLSVQWTQALRRDTDPTLKEIISDTLIISQFTLDVFAPGGKRQDNALFKALTLAQLTSQHGKDLQLTLRLIVPSSGPVNPESEAAKLQKAFTDIISSRGIGHYSIETAYVPPESVPSYRAYTLTPPRAVLDRLHTQGKLLNFMQMGTDSAALKPWTDEASVAGAFLY